MTNLNHPSEALDTRDLEELRELVKLEAPRVAELGQWPEWKKPQAVGSLTSRIPKKDETAPGFDAGIACALDMIPREKQALAASLHGDYTPARVEQVRKELKELDPDSESAWWLAGCSVCGKEEKTDENGFRDQLRQFESLSANPQGRHLAAQKEIERMKSLFETKTLDGVPFGTEDGCMQGAYLDGYPFAVQFASQYGLNFIGTYHESLGLEDFKWSEEKDKEGRAKSGPVWGSKQFVKCANEEELKRALEIVKKRFPKENPST